MRLYVGTYWLSGFRLKLYLDGSADFSSCTSPTAECPFAQMVVTCSGDCRFGAVLAGLIHEAVEFCLSIQMTSYRPINEFKETSQHVLFVASHNDFDQATARAGIFIGECLDAVRAKWKKIKR